MLNDPNRPDVISHRGFHTQGAWENSMEAFSAGMTLGADSIETDVMRTKDGVFVLHHDAVLADGRKIADLNFAELPKLPNGSKIPRLDELVQLAKIRHANISVELKEKGYELAVADAIAGVLPTSQFELISFNKKSIRAIEDHNADIRTGLLQPYMYPFLRESKIWPWVVKLIYNPLHLVTKAAESSHADFVSVDDETATDSMLDDAAKKGIEVDVWTVDTTTGLRKFLGDRRVHGVVTNYPDLAMRIRSALGWDTGKSQAQ